MKKNGSMELGGFPLLEALEGRVLLAGGPVLISEVPAYLWRDGCGPTAAGMVLGYWDMHGSPNVFPGDSSTQTAAVDLAISSDEHYNDYSVPIDTDETGVLADKSELGGAHSDNCLADWMHTSRSVDGNVYGGSWYTAVGPAITAYTRSVGYTGFSTKDETWGTFTWSHLQTEIDKNQPVVLLVDSDGDGQTDHFVPAIGYNDTTHQYACYNTWDTTVQWFSFAPMVAGAPWGIYGATLCSLTADTTGPTVQFTQFSGNPAAPTYGCPSTLTVTGSASDAESGIVSDAYSFRLQKWNGTQWVDSGTYGPNSGTAALGPLADGTYRITLSATNGQELTSQSAPRYFQVGPAVIGVSSTAANRSYFKAGGTVRITVAFSVAVAVTGTPQLALNDGGTAFYTGGNGTSTLTFTYTVAPGQNTPNLDYISTAALTLNGGSIKDGNGDVADLTLPNVGTDGLATKRITIDTTVPTVAGVSTTGVAGLVYRTGWTVPITVTFSEAVVVGGVPFLTLSNGGRATYVSGNGTSTIGFNYTVGYAQDTAVLDYASTAALTLNGGSILDLAGNVAVLVLPATGTDALATAGIGVRCKTPPWIAQIDSPVGLPDGSMSIPYVLAEEDSDACNIQVEFSTDGGTTWAPATAGFGPDGAVNLPSSPAGTPHRFVWDVRKDLGPAKRSVQVMIIPTYANTEGASDTSDPFVVNEENLSAVLGTPWTLPTSVVARKASSAKVSVVVTNLGNVPVGPGRMMFINFVLRNLTVPGDPDCVLLAISKPLARGLAPGGFQTFTGTVKLPIGLAPGDYQILATIKSLAGDVTLTAGGATKTIAVRAQPDFALPAYRQNDYFWNQGLAPASTHPPALPGNLLGRSLGHCTWYANGRLRELGYDSADLNLLTGGAAEWAAQAAGIPGVSLSTTPTAGAIALDPTPGREHVAVVEAVNADGSIVISESRAFSKDARGHNRTFLWAIRTVLNPAAEFSTYIIVPRL
ncbi:MAG: C39 family peptidase [Planctomycetota bacterium]|nr:C39 family peptidase [Planctomycetota bacterium]